MIGVTFYNIQTGKITRTAMLDEAMVDLNLLAGEGWIAGNYDATKNKVVGGSVVDIPNSEIEAVNVSNAWNDLRQGRNARLADSDWTQVPDAPVDQAAWATYRQKLRDLPENTTDPREVVWPQEPQ